tara:strand:- start:131 stop:313 length:183 start_codon:yes stop_codon:yes gene_type:complete
MKQSNLKTYKFIKKTFKIPDEICFIISKFVGKLITDKDKDKIRWVRLKYPNEKRLVRVSY